jgi:serine/threonine-protein kinase RsbW
MASRLVPHAPSSASNVRHELVVDLTTHDVPAAVVDDAALVLSELVGNAVRHASPLPDGCVCVSWELTDRALHLEVRDGGVDGDAAPRQQPVAEPEHVPASAENGRGLTIVSLLAQRWGTMDDCGQGAGVYADLDVRRDGLS